jgi:hypothetical protein
MCSCAKGLTSLAGSLLGAPGAMGEGRQVGSDVTAHSRNKTNVLVRGLLQNEGIAGA